MWPVAESVAGDYPWQACHVGAEDGLDEKHCRGLVLLAPEQEVELAVVARRNDLVVQIRPHTTREAEPNVNRGQVCAQIHQVKVQHFG